MQALPGNAEDIVDKIGTPDASLMLIDKTEGSHQYGCTDHIKQTVMQMEYTEDQR